MSKVTVLCSFHIENLCFGHFLSRLRSILALWLQYNLRLDSVKWNCNAHLRCKTKCMPHAQCNDLRSFTLLDYGARKCNNQRMHHLWRGDNFHRAHCKVSAPVRSLVVYTVSALTLATYMLHVECSNSVQCMCTVLALVNLQRILNVHW